MHRTLSVILRKCITPLFFTLVLLANIQWFRHASNIPLFESAIMLSLCCMWAAVYWQTQKLRSRVFVTTNLLMLTVCVYTYSKFFVSGLEAYTSITLAGVWLLAVWLLSYASYKQISSLVLLLKLGGLLVWLTTFVMLISYKYYGAINQEFVFAIMQTNANEVAEYLGQVVISGTFYGFLFLFCIVGFAFHCFSLSYSVRLTNTPSFYILNFIFIIYAVTSPQVFNGLKVANQYAETYRQELNLLQTIIEKRRTHEPENTAIASTDGKMHILVVGESLSKRHLSSYGYQRDTTPFINTSEPIQFENAYSSHTHTMETLSLALTQSNQYNELDYFQSASLISLFNQAGFQTAWISNQISAGVWDNLVSALAQESEYVRFINSNVGKSDHTRKLDDALVNELAEYLQQADLSRNQFIVLHMMGSHIRYCDRTKDKAIPLEHLPFYVYLDKQDDCYDQSVIFTDRILQDIHTLASSYKAFTSLTYLSDHGEDVFSHLGHDANKFNEYMAEIPFVIWPSDKFDPVRLANLKSHQSALFTNDLLFDTMLGITEISSDAQDVRYDISDHRYDLPNNVASTMHGQIPIHSLAFQKTQSNLGKLPKLMAHRVNTVGALEDAIRQGFSRIEFDVWFDGKSNRIVMGHDEHTLTGQSLEHFLEFESGRFEQVWIDFKNLAVENQPTVQRELEMLDARFNLKSRTLLETSSRSPSVATLPNSGWSTSYYLPTKALTTLSKVENEQAINQLIGELQMQLIAQKIQSISFDASLMPFVTKHLTQPILVPLQIEMNIWTDLRADSPTLEQELAQRKLNHPVLDNIIVIHQSRFKY